MPYVIMTLCGVVVLASYLLPIKWILENRLANRNEKAVFIFLTIPFWIFSYYLFFIYLKYSRSN